MHFDCHGGWPWGWLPGCIEPQGAWVLVQTFTVLWFYSLRGEIQNNTEYSNNNNSGPIRAVPGRCKRRGLRALIAISGEVCARVQGKQLGDRGRGGRGHSGHSRAPGAAVIYLPCGFNYSNILIFGRAILALCVPSFPSPHSLHISDIRHWCP